MSSPALATVTLTGTPTGASGVVTEVGEDGTTTKTTVYAGVTGSCSGGTTATCNTCTGAPISIGGTSYQISPCNPTAAHQNLILNMEFSVNNTSVTSSTDVTVKVGDNEVVSGSVTSVYSGGVLSVSVPWGALCTKADSNASTDCSKSFTEDLTVGFKNIGGSSGSTDTTTLTISVSSVDMTAITKWFYTDCDVDNGGAEPTNNTGFCHFETYPGDAKIYADRLFVQPNGYPNSDNDVDYRGIVFFYEEQQGGETNAQTIARITNASPMTSISLNTRASPPVGDNRITGLNNGSTYCFVMANQDRAGNIYYITPVGNAPSPRPDTELCGTPEKVVGLLDDKSCFIATAAFGSDMAPEVQSFRDFRNEFLFSNKLGKEFVRFYYKHSPYYANLIAQSDAARGIVRLMLWPLLLFAKVSVAFGLWAGIALILTALGSVALIYRRFKLPKSRGVA